MSIDPWLANTGAKMYRCTKCSFTRCTVETNEDRETLVCPLDGKNINSGAYAPKYEEVSNE